LSINDGAKLFCCYNADTFGDESIGSARVNLEGLLDGGSPDVWVPLEKVNSGEIRLEIEPIKNDDNSRMKVGGFLLSIRLDLATGISKRLQIRSQSLKLPRYQLLCAGRSISLVMSLP
jgi:hypothetical protein